MTMTKAQAADKAHKLWMAGEGWDGRIRGMIRTELRGKLPATADRFWLVLCLKRIQERMNFAGWVEYRIPMVGGHSWGDTYERFASHLAAAEAKGWTRKTILDAFLKPTEPEETECDELGHTLEDGVCLDCAPPEVQPAHVWHGSPLEKDLWCARCRRWRTLDSSQPCSGKWPAEVRTDAPDPDTLPRFSVRQVEEAIEKAESLGCADHIVTAKFRAALGLSRREDT